MRFIDLFSGLGGFNLALSSLGHKCVFASEIDEQLREIYKRNFEIEPRGDIRNINVEEIPKHDILCAGFPCTPFSKAGKRQGRKDKKNGDLFDEIVRILEYHKPKYFILENVTALYNHDGKETWNYIESRLTKKLGYEISKNSYSPHEFGVPQHRKRLFIVGSTTKLNNFNWIDKYKFKSETSIKNIIDNRNKRINISTSQQHCIKVWQNFLDVIPQEEYLFFPIWAQEFGATYPYEDKTPFICSINELSNYKGSFGENLIGKKEEILKLLPSYAIRKQNKFPEWKKRFIRLNREFYLKYKSQLDLIIPQIKALPVPSWQKFEWNSNGEKRVLKNQILQFRSSGLRAKCISTAPSLVCPKTQIPIIGWMNRYISRKEALKLHSMERLKYLPKNDSACFKALGNAVNVKIVYLICKELIQNHS